MAGIEGAGVGGVGEITFGGHLQSPAFRLRRTAEVTPTGVGIHAAGHPRHWRRLRPGGTGVAVNLHIEPLPGPGGGNTRDRVHTPTCEIGGTGPP